MAIIMIFELTLDYRIILPLMPGVRRRRYTSVSLRSARSTIEALKRSERGIIGINSQSYMSAT